MTEEEQIESDRIRKAFCCGLNRDDRGEDEFNKEEQQE